MIYKRDLEKDILEGAKYFPVVAILGPRQSGKTTLAQMIFKNHVYLSLEDPDLRAAAINDPRTFLLTNYNEYGIIIDEFQYVPSLLSYIQTIADKEKKPGYFILTDSQNFLMNQAIAQSLAGRISLHTLLPLSIGELKANDILPQEVETILYQGCYPAIYAKKVPAQRLYSNYMQTYIERDVRQLSNIGDLNTFQTFITLCATRIGQLLNLTSLANECGISDKTAKRWISILEASYIIYLEQPYYNNLGKRLVKTPKIYFYDTGLASFLLKIKEEELALHPNRGGLFESLIISDIRKWHYNNSIIPSVYFWRDQTGHEIDCIVEHGLKLIPIEIKSGRTSSPRFFEGINYWNKIAGKETSNGFVVYGGDAQQAKGYNNLISWQNVEKILKKLL